MKKVLLSIVFLLIAYTFVFPAYKTDYLTVTKNAIIYDKLAIGKQTTPNYTLDIVGTINATSIISTITTANYSITANYANTSNTANYVTDTNIAYKNINNNFSESQYINANFKALDVTVNSLWVNYVTQNIDTESSIYVSTGNIDALNSDMRVKSLNAGDAIYIANANLNDNGTLTNVAYLQQTNTFDADQNFNYNINGNTINGNLINSDAVVFGQIATQNIATDNTITANGTYLLIQSTGGAVTLSSNPQISSVNDNYGYYLIIQGLSDINTITLINGNGLKLSNGANFTLGLDDIITFIWNGVYWLEISRANN